MELQSLSRAKAHGPNLRRGRMQTPWRLAQRFVRSFRRTLHFAVGADAQEVRSVSYLRSFLARERDRKAGRHKITRAGSVL